MNRLFLLSFSLFAFPFSFAVAGSACLCGEAPERANDFFWENDRVGFRAYGPGDVHKWSGIGMDDYAVGPGRGVGGVAFRKDGQWLADYGNWFRYRVLTNGDERCAFELDYRLPFGGTMTLGIALERGQSLFHETVSFSPDTPLDGVEVGIGLDLNEKREHVGDLVVDGKRKLVSLFEKPHNRPGEEGAMMNAVRLAAGFEATFADEPNGAKMLMTRPLTKADANGRPVLAVWAGADWSVAGRYTTAAAWHAYVRGFGDAYLDLTEAAVAAYDDEHLVEYLADVEREGVQEHGFPRLSANLGVLVANGRCLARREILRRMMTACCRDAAKGKMPPKSGGNEFSVKELVEAVVALERAQVYPKETTDAWRAALSSVAAERCYTTGRIPVGNKTSHNWVVFAAASEQARLAHGMGGDPAFVEKYVADQIRWFDDNGMYRDPNQPAVYDFVTRLQFALILHNGYAGASRARLEELLDRSAEPTLMMLSACGEIPYGGRSNQFLNNNTFYAALCEWYAARYAGRGEATTAARFRQAARAAVDAIRPWLAEDPILHVKNRYPREAGKSVYSEKGDMGCERYAYFDKYMVTMGSWSTLGWLFADGETATAPVKAGVADSFVTTPDFHFVFLRAGEYSAQFDYNADTHYDCDGLGRVQRCGAPVALCLSVPCAKHPNYRTETPNDAPLAILPVVPKETKLVHVRTASGGSSAVSDWMLSLPSNTLSWSCRLDPSGLTSSLAGDGPIALTLPAFAFDGREASQIEAAERTLTVAYRGWVCRYETNGEIVDTGRSACNRNGRYRRFEARGADSLEVKITLERKDTK